MLSYRVDTCKRCKKNTFCMIQHDWKNPEKTCGINRWDPEWEAQELDRIQKEKEKKQAERERNKDYYKKYRQKPGYKEKHANYMREYMPEYQRRPDVAERINARARDRWQKKKVEAGV